jgi:excisionase family DNA binding protein
MMTEKMAISIAEAANLSGVGRTTIYQAIGRGDISVKKAGRRSLILLTDLQRWLEGLPTSGASAVSLKRRAVAASEAE